MAVDGSDLICRCGCLGQWKIDWTWSDNNIRYTNYETGYELDFLNFAIKPSPSCQSRFGIANSYNLISGCNGRVVYADWVCANTSIVNPVFTFTRDPGCIEYIRIDCSGSPGGLCCIPKTTIESLCERLNSG